MAKTETVQMRDYVDQRFTDAGMNVDQRFKDLYGHIDQRFKDQEGKTDVTLTASTLAADKLEKQGENWRKSANEWRGAMTDRERDFLSRKEFYAIVGTAIAVIGFLVFLVPYLRGK
jgi:hypothetical protein